MKKLITYATFILSTIAIVLVFVTAKSYTQLAIGTLIYPLLAYFAFTLFPRENRITVVSEPNNNLPQAAPATNASGPVKESVEIVDIDKRTFLKLVGTAGVSFFIFSILSRKVESLLFGRAFNSGMSGLPGQYVQSPGSPSETTEGYNITEVDDVGAISYFGFTTKEGAWLIMKGNADGSSYRYVKGNKNFPDNWANRESLKYDYYYNLF